MKKFDTEVRLSREMSLMDATLIGVGAMIGAGIFVLIGIAAGVAGPALLLSFVLNGLIAALTAMSYAELGSCYHDAGGGYLWVKEGLPRWNGFISGWMSWFAHAVACSLYALGFGAYFNHVLHELGASLPEWSFMPPEKLLAAIVAIIFAYINFRGASETGKVGNVVTIAKIIILAVFIGFGLERISHRTDALTAFTPFFANGWSGVVKAMGLTFIAFQGFEVISQCSEEIKNPKKSIPRAVFLSLLIVVPIYLFVAIVALGAVQPNSGTSWDYLASHKEIALVEVAKTFFSGGGIMLLVGGLISTLSALNATIYSSSRVAFAMGRDRNFPSFFSKVHEKKFTPHWSILVSLIIVVAMAVSLPIEDVASSADIMFLLLFLQVNIAMIRLRKKRPDLDRGFVTPLFPWLSILGIVLLLALAAYMATYSPTAWIVTGVWIILGLLGFKFYASHREVEHVRKVRALERIEKKEYRILVSISNPASVSSLVSVALAIAKKHQAEIIVQSVVEIMEKQPLVVGANIAKTSPELDLLAQAEAQIREAGVPVRTILQASHRISEGIVQTAEEEECNFVILGGGKQQTFMERLFSSVIESVIQKAPCEVAVLNGILPEQGIKNVLVPFGQDVHTRLAFEMTPAIMEHFHCQARIGIVFEPGITQGLKKQQVQKIEELAKEQGLSVPIAVAADEDIRQGVIKLAKRSDLIIMAGRTGDFLKLLLGRSLVQEITDEAECPVLWVKEYEEQQSFWKGLFESYPRKLEEEHG